MTTIYINLHLLEEKRLRCLSTVCIMPNLQGYKFPHVCLPCNKNIQRVINFFKLDCRVQFFIKKYN